MKLSESESKVIELLSVSEALEVKLSQTERERCVLQAQLDHATASANQPVSQHDYVYKPWNGLVVSTLGIRAGDPGSNPGSYHCSIG